MGLDAKRVMSLAYPLPQGCEKHLVAGVAGIMWRKRPLRLAGGAAQPADPMTGLETGLKASLVPIMVRPSSSAAGVGDAVVSTAARHLPAPHQGSVRTDVADSATQKVLAAIDRAATQTLKAMPRHKNAPVRGDVDGQQRGAAPIEPMSETAAQ